MAITNDEVLRAKAECGYNVIAIGAEAYALEGYVALFDRAIQPYLIDYQTTCATTVTAAASPTAVALTLASNPAVPGNTTQPLAFSVGANVIVDVGPQAETSMVLTLSGLVINCTLSNAHGSLGAYPVKLRGGEQFVRDLFGRIDAINTHLNGTAIVTAGIKKTDEAEFYASGSGRRVATKDRFAALVEQRTNARRELCLLLGIPYLPDYRRRGSDSFEPY